MQEAPLERTQHGLAPRGGGWYVLNMRDAEWRHADGRGAVCVVSDDFEGWRRDADQLGVNPFVLMPGEPMALYHREADQEGFLVGAQLLNVHLAATGQRLRSATFVGALLHGADFSGTSLDKVNLRHAIVTFNTGQETLHVWIPPAPGQPNDEIPWPYGATILRPESTGKDTLCPDGSSGPCARRNLELPVPDTWRYPAARRAEANPFVE